MNSFRSLPIGLAAWRQALAGLALVLACLPTQAQTLSESSEIVYSGDDAQALRDKAQQLGNAVAIYEHLHNTMEHSPYHGSRSGSVNTFLGQRGSDVDIATALIAMLRSQGIPARYAVGTIRLPAAQFSNWLGIPHLDTAVEVLKWQGFQKLEISSDRSSVDFEHVWAEAFVPFDQYRGANAVSPAVDCSQGANASRCTWVGLDASFKQKTYNGLNLDPYNAVAFDYPAYYNAIKNNDAARRDKNPFAILEDQIGAWLRANHPGKTLEDVEDAGKIIELREGLLPASLPYQVVGAVRRYDSVAAHDAVVPGTEPRKWGKRLRIGITNGSIELGSTSVLLADASVKRLTVTTEQFIADRSPSVVVRLGGVEIARPVQAGLPIRDFVGVVGSPFTISLGIDGAPGRTEAAQDDVITSDYAAAVGGYYVIASGGETSNWSQVHRAATQLLGANAQYRIVLNGNEAGCQIASGINCTPYVDANGNGWDASDAKLLESREALDALTGGLLYVSASQYYAKMREQFERADRLMKIRSPLIAFIGAVSSVYEAEYIDGTAFSILPGGLLIDMKGIATTGQYRINESAINNSNRQFEFFAHIASSLEHEIWQELTGYDAVSTVRGIQMAMAEGCELIQASRRGGVDTVAELYSKTGFSSNPNHGGFTYAPYDVFATRPATWSHATAGATFQMMASIVDPSTSALRKSIFYYRHNPPNSLNYHASCIDGYENQWLATATPPLGGNFCGTNFPIFFVPPPYTQQTWMLHRLNQHWMNTVIPNYVGQQAFDYLDRAKGFDAGRTVYRALPVAANAHPAALISYLRNIIYLSDPAAQLEFVLPSRRTSASTYNQFTVYIGKEYSAASGTLDGIAMTIANEASISAGGGYVSLKPLKSLKSPKPGAADRSTRVNTLQN